MSNYKGMMDIPEDWNKRTLRQESHKILTEDEVKDKLLNGEINKQDVFDLVSNNKIKFSEHINNDPNWLQSKAKKIKENKRKENKE